MYSKLVKILLLWQLSFSAGLIIFGMVNGLRCLFAGRIFCAFCLVFIGYVCGYRLMFRSSLRELRKANTKTSRHKS